MRWVFLAFLTARGGGDASDPRASSLGVQWGTPEDDEALALVPARGGGLYVGGYAGGTVRVSNIGPVGNARGFVRKLTPAGQVQWEAALDTGQTDIVEALAEAPDDRVYPAGRTTGAFAGATQAGQFDAFTAVVADRAASSLRHYGDERPQHPRRLALSGPRLLVAGFDDVFVPTNYVEDWENWFAADLSAEDLGEAWRVPASRTAYGDVAAAILVDVEGGAYVAGSSQGGAQPGIGVRKLDVGGRELWGSRLSSSGIDTAAALAFAADGSLLLAGTHFGGSEPVLTPIDRASGAPRWTTSGPRALNGAAVTDMTVDAAGSVYLAGATSAVVAPQYTNRGACDPYLMRFDAGGRLTGTWQGGTAADEEPTATALPFLRPGGDRGLDGRLDRAGLFRTAGRLPARGPTAGRVRSRTSRDGSGPAGSPARPPCGAGRCARVRPSGGAAMKARVVVTLKRSVLDPQGLAVGRALGSLGFNEVKDVRLGKIIELDLEAKDPAEAKKRVQEMCEKLLANTVIEEYQVEEIR